MRKETPLDYAEFLLTQTRTRCELYVYANGVREKLASGYIKPFIVHLRTAEVQFAKGNNVIRLEPPPDQYRKTFTIWFTKGTVERFVRYVSTPEVLEQVKSIEDELSQLEQVRLALSKSFSQTQLKFGSRDLAQYSTDAYQERGGMSMLARRFPMDPDDNTAEASKRELLRAMDVRLVALNQEQQVAYSRAIAAGFDSMTLANLMDFSDYFGAERLRDVCLQFMVLSRKLALSLQEEENLDSPSADAASNASDMSLESVSDVELVSETESGYYSNSKCQDTWRDVQIDDMDDDQRNCNLNVEQNNAPASVAPARTRSRWGPPERIQINSFDPDGCLQDSEVLERGGDFSNQNQMENEQFEESEVSSSPVSSLEQSDNAQKPLTVVPPNIGPRIPSKQFKDKKSESAGKGGTFFTRLQKMAQQVEARRSSEDLGVHFASVKMSDEPIPRGGNMSLSADSQQRQPAVVETQEAKPSTTTISTFPNIQSPSEGAQTKEKLASTNTGTCDEEKLRNETKNEEKTVKVPDTENEDNIADAKEEPVSTSARRISVAAAISLFEKKKTDTSEAPLKKLSKQESVNGTSEATLKKPSKQESLIGTSQNVSSSSVSEKSVLRRWSCAGSVSSVESSSQEKDAGVMSMEGESIKVDKQSKNIIIDSSLRNGNSLIDQKEAQQAAEKQIQKSTKWQKHIGEERAPEENNKITQEHITNSSQSHNIDSSTILKGELQKQFKLQLEKSLARNWNRSGPDSVPPKSVVESMESSSLASKTSGTHTAPAKIVPKVEILHVPSPKNVLDSSTSTTRKFVIPPPPPPPKPVVEYPKIFIKELKRDETPQPIGLKSFLQSSVLHSNKSHVNQESEPCQPSTVAVSSDSPKDHIAQSKSVINYLPSQNTNNGIPKDDFSDGDSSKAVMSLPKDLHCVTESPKVSDLGSKRLLKGQAREVNNTEQQIKDTVPQEEHWEWKEQNIKCFEDDGSEDLTISKQEKPIQKPALNKEPFTGKVRHHQDCNRKLEKKLLSSEVQQNMERRSSALTQNSSVDLYMQALVMMMDNQNPKSLNIGNGDSLDDEQRGKFYEQYRRLRDARQLKEHPAKKAEREAKLKSMKETLERRKSEMVTGGASKLSKKNINEKIKVGKHESQKLNSIELQKRQKELGEDSETTDQDERTNAASPVPRSHISNGRTPNGKKAPPSLQKLSSIPRSSLSSSVSSPKIPAGPPTHRRVTSSSYNTSLDVNGTNSLLSVTDVKKEVRKSSSRRSSTSSKNYTRAIGHSRTMSDAAIDDIMSGTGYEETKPQSSVNRRVRSSLTGAKASSTLSSDHTTLDTSRSRKIGNVINDSRGQGTGLKRDSIKQKASQNSNKVVPEKNVISNAPSDLRKSFIQDDSAVHSLTYGEACVQDGSDYEESSEVFVDATCDEGVLCVDDADQEKCDNGYHEERCNLSTTEVSQIQSNCTTSYNALPLTHSNYFSEPRPVNLRLAVSSESPLGSPAARAASQAKFTSEPSPVSQSPKEPKGFKKLLHFGRRGRNLDPSSGDSPATSEWDGDTEEPSERELVRQSSDDLFRRMKFQGSDNGMYQDQGSDNMLRSSIPAPPSAFKMQEDQISGSSLLKAPRSFFSLSTFRSRASEGRSR